MALIEAELATYLMGVTELVALIGTRVYPNVAPSGNTYPCVTYFKVTSNRVRDMGGESGLVQSRIQVNAWAIDTATSRGYAAAKAVADKIRTKLDSFRGTMGATQIDAIFLLDESDLFDKELAVNEAVVYGIRQDFQVRHRETVDANTI